MKEYITRFKYLYLEVFYPDSKIEITFDEELSDFFDGWSDAEINDYVTNAILRFIKKGNN